MEKPRRNRKDGTLAKNKPTSENLDTEMDDESDGKNENTSSDDCEDSDFEAVEDAEDAQESDSDDSEGSFGGSRRNNRDPDVIIRWMPDGSSKTVYGGNQTETRIVQNPAFPVSGYYPRYPAPASQQWSSSANLGRPVFKNMPSMYKDAATANGNKHKKGDSSETAHKGEN
ncbi:hypothetical protein SLEP1_g28060 [Rubroshorea leprosula]|uniref:Uncharacterized protein n=1 Tax=Rubroshorea leprosula TaxID=152421 RepID=A0AAV5JV32_9ROSI|nr:hypothetical protein SLEP1_g28060 [Rubroshorea leprosula]